MRILGDLLDRGFEIDLPVEWTEPAQVEAIWRSDLSQPEAVLWARIVLSTWEHIGHQPPDWLFLTLEEQETYLWRSWIAVHIDLSPPLIAAAVTRQYALRDGIDAISSRPARAFLHKSLIPRELWPGKNSGVAALLSHPRIAERRVRRKRPR